MSSHVDGTVKRNLESLQHFSHDHPLIYVEDQENPKAYCSACGVALISSPSYTCSQGCNFFLHIPCKELLQSTKLKFGGHRYDLSLLAKPPHDDCKCEKCGNSCKNFTYKCSTSYTPYSYPDHLYTPYSYPDHFYLHCQCAFPLEISIKHISHHEHALMAMCKEASLVCDACGKKQDGIFFSCQKCSFYIHQDCCSLPTIINIKHHLHPLFILYSLRTLKFWHHMKCIFCKDEVSLALGAYVCGWCSSVAHLHCAASAVSNTVIVKEYVNLPSMPNTFSSLITRAILENREEDAIEDDVKWKIEKYHTDHSSWIFHHQDRDDFQLVCNACILPITILSHPSYYSCPQPQCFFLLHESCANLPPVIKIFYRRKPIHLFSKSSYFCSVFSCDRCLKYSNGFGYDAWVSIDVQCATSPNTVKHESHSQHLLTLSTHTKNFCCCDPDAYGNDTSYSCGICDHNIHTNCAFLPKTVEHKFDEHPLDLIFNPTVQIPRGEEEEENNYLCEICEENINPNFWFYYCGKCDQSFHVNCIPSTGKLSKIKFGCNIDLPRHVHDHPVTLTRMLTMGSQTCGHCKYMIQGFVDDMAFHCSDCDFWIHFECAKQCFYYCK